MRIIRQIRRLLCAGVVLIVLPVQGLAGPSPINKSLLRKHVAALADDSMQGRRAGTDGEQKASRYLALEFERSGVPPAGNDGSYFQPFSLNTAKIYSTSFLRVGTDTLRYPRDFFIYRVPDVVTVWSRGMVFVAHGVHQLDDGMDTDLRVDLRGRLAVVLAPGDSETNLTPSHVRTSSNELASWARVQGAGGIILLARRGPRQLAVTHERYVAAELFKPIDTTGFLWIKVSDGERFLREHFKSTEFSAPVLATPVVSNIQVESSMDVLPIVASNVVGILEGTDRRHELIVVTAHYDHLGMNTRIGPDSIYNGALDNASGVSAMLEIARSLSHSKAKPLRTIVFLATSAEESGLQGSRHFLEHPSVQGEIVANINLEFTGFTMDIEECRLVLLGGEYTNMKSIFQRAASETGIRISDSYLPSFYLRSDCYTFVEAGIPSIMPSPGFSRRQAMDGLNEFKKFYHQPNDELGRIPLDFGTLQQQTQAIALGVWEVAQAGEKPAWTRSVDSRNWLKIRDMWGLARMWFAKHVF